MSYEDRIRDKRAGMSKSFAKLADYLLDSYVEAAFMTATELAHALKLDAATVVRFSQHLGYDGFPGLQNEIRDRVRADLLTRPRQAEITASVPGIVTESMQQLAVAIDQTRISLDTDQVSQLVEQIGQARRIIILAEGPAQAAAYNLVHLLEPGGFRVYIARQGVTDLAQTVYTATPQDLLIAVEVTGELPYLARALEAAKEREIPTGAIVGAPAHASAQVADIVLAARAHPTVEVRMVTVNAIVYVLAQAIRWRFIDRFSGAQQTISTLSNFIQKNVR
jgi:DNA-binding MurR/RpiR family transcriptional regulator